MSGLGREMSRHASGGSLISHGTHILHLYLYHAISHLGNRLDIQIQCDLGVAPTSAANEDLPPVLQYMCSLTSAWKPTAHCLTRSLTADKILDC